MQIIPEEPIHRKLFLLIAISIVVFATITVTEAFLRRLTLSYDAAIANQNSRRSLGRIVLSELLSIERNFHKLVSTDDPRDVNVFEEQIMISVEKIESIIGVLQNGGEYENVMPANLYGIDEIRERMSYSTDEGSGYVVEVIDLRPKILDIKTTASELVSAVNSKLNAPEGDDRMPLTKSAALMLKQGDTFLLRSRESASKIFYNTSIEVQRLEEERVSAVRLFEIVRYSVTGIIVCLGIAVYIRVIRQIAKVIAERHQANKELADYRDHLEELVRERTEQLKARTDQQLAVAEFGRIALLGIELPELLDQAVSLVSRILDTKYAGILEHKADDHVLVLRAGVGWKEGYIGHKSVPDGVGSQSGYLLRQSGPVIVEDISSETRFSPPPLLIEHGVVSGMCTAIPCHGRPFGILGVYTDKELRFTEDDSRFLQSIANILADALQRKRAEEELETERRQLLSMFDSMDELIYVCEPESYEILYMNGAAREQWGNRIGQECYRALQGNDSPCPFCTNEHIFGPNIGKSRTYEFQNNSNSRWYRCFSKAIRWSDGRMVRFEMAIDITEHRRAEEELQKVQRLESIGLLAGGIAHDLNNFLTAIVGNIALARMYNDPEEKNKTALEAEKAAMQVRNLTQQLLTFSKGGVPIKELAIIGERLNESVTFALRGSNVRCEFSIPDDLWPAQIDVGQIDQVINNLIINATQAMPKGGTIKASAKNMIILPEQGLPLEPGAYIRLSFRDQGIGIPEESLQKIFDPFFTTKHKGNGLGLATSYSIIKKHDGHITVDSELGVGTTFHVYLPASPEEILAMEEKEETVPIKGKGRILIMDDEESLREAMAKIGEFLGYEVTTATDGAEAVKQYRNAMESDPFDAVIMDLTIPGGMGGKETIQKLQEMDSEVKAIVSSGYSNDPIMADFRQYGFMDVITKPYEVQRLSEVLHKIVTNVQNGI